MDAHEIVCDACYGSGKEGEDGYCQKCEGSGRMRSDGEHIFFTPKNKTFRNLLEGLIAQGESSKKIADWVVAYGVSNTGLIDLIREYVANPLARYCDIQINLYSEYGYQTAMKLFGNSIVGDAAEWTIVVDGELLTPGIQKVLAELKAEYKINWR